MSGLVGLFCRDARPAHLGTLRSVAAAAQHRGPDGARFFVDGALAIGHQWLRLSPHQTPRSQWLVDARRRFVVTLDGRLDNRAELLRLCGHHLHCDTPGDADLVLAAYQEWHEQCAAHLIGDFAFVVWDGDRQRLYAARDVCGVKPFFYALDERRFVWGSDLRQILAADGHPAPNEPMVAEYLAGAITSRSETLYRGVMRLPAGHWLSVTPGRARVERYWSPEAVGELLYRTDDEYAEHFLSLVRDAVADRLGSADPVAAYLSGGLDSSSVVGLARSLGRAVESFSLTFPDIPAADERQYIDAVAARWKLTAHQVEAGPFDGRAACERSRRRADVMDMPSDLLGERLLDRVRARGFRTVLTGAGGDYGLSGSFFHYADLLRAADWRGLVRQLAADRRMSDVQWSPSVLFAYGIRPLLPQTLRAAARPMARAVGLVGGRPTWITDELVSRTRLDERLRPRQARPARSLARRDVCETFESGLVAWFLESKERSAAEYLIEERHPFFDRRLVEFTIAIPEHQRWRGEQTKVVLRRALRHILPDSVYARTDKGDFSACVVDAIEQVGHGLDVDIDALQIADIGWVSQPRVSAMYRDLRLGAAADDPRYCQVMFPLWHVLGVEHWFRAGFAKGRRDEPQQSLGIPEEWCGPGADGRPQAVRAARAR